MHVFMGIESKASTSNKMLYARLDDLVDMSRRNNTYSFLGFLDEKEVLMARSYLKKNKISNYKFYGGYDKAIRNCISVWDYGSEPCEDEFPIYGLTFFYSSENQLGHRDFLGSLMNMGISRDSIGDILVGDGFSVIFFKDKVASFVKNEANKVGNTHVTVKQEIPHVLPPAFTLVPIETIISSNRLDCIVSAITSVSRNDAVNYINNAYASVNFEQCTKITKQLVDGDILSLRGFGRFIFEGETGMTKKGRIKVLFNKYV